MYFSKVEIHEKATCDHEGIYMVSNNILKGCNIQAMID